MKVAIFGLGYVGVVTAACLARDGHQVVGVDVNSDKVLGVGRGESPIIEPGVADLLERAVAADQLWTTTDASEAVVWADAMIVCVGTPSAADGSVDMAYVDSVVSDIAKHAARSARPITLILRSTSPPGTLARLRGKIAADHPTSVISMAFNPEFLREGSAVYDFDHPPFTIIGTQDEQAGAVVEELYARVDAEVLSVEPEVAETIKYASNAWHATKITFANEIGRIAESFGVDGRSVMDVLVQDTKLNISPAYMKPGFAYGGSCLPKDVAALLAMGRIRNLELPLLSSLPESNTAQIRRGVAKTLATGGRTIAVLGLAFKPGTDDLRESAAVLLVKQLLGEGCEVKIYDPAVNEARLFGTNLAFIRDNLRHFEQLLVDDLDETLHGADTVVVTHPTPEVRAAVEGLSPDIAVVDLSGMLGLRGTN